MICGGEAGGFGRKLVVLGTIHPHLLVVEAMTSISSNFLCLCLIYANRKAKGEVPEK